MRYPKAFSRSVQRAWQPLLGVFLAVYVILALPSAVQAGWDGNVEMQLGDSFAAAYAQIPGSERHLFHFFAPAGTLLSAAWTVDSGDLQPRVELLKADGSEVFLGTAFRGNKINKFLVAESGDYSLQISAAVGTGGYTLRTKAKFPTKFAVVTEDDSVAFAAVRGSLLSAKVKAGKGSVGSPSFSSLEGRFGEVELPHEHMTKAAAPGSMLKNLALPFSGNYDLGIDLGGEGPVAVKGKIRPPKGGRLYFLGVIDMPTAATAMTQLWQGSGHGDASAEAFRHWDAEGEVSASCARCHSGLGFSDFIGADGSADNRFDIPAQGDGPAALGSTVDCNACHSTTATALDAVVFPSGEIAAGLGPEARCMQCHQGRESTVSVDARIAGASPVDDDMVTSGLSFRNVHYFAAGATLYGGGARGAYQYGDGLSVENGGKLYDGLNPHVPEANTCIECHNPHSLELEIADTCFTCHVNRDGAPVATLEDLKDIRMAGSTVDYDGDGNVTEGLYYELETLSETLYSAIQDYAANVIGAGIVYDAGSYPYWFTTTGSGYSQWTARLMRATYNYQYWQKDPGAFAHNPKYMVQVLYDSIADLASNQNVDVPQFAAMHRADTGHFDGQSEAFRHWDTMGEDSEGDDVFLGGIDRGDVSSSCAPCHSNGGFNVRAMYNVDTMVDMPVGDGMECGTCHVGGDFRAATPATKFVASVEFPGGTVIANSSSAPDSSFICLSCHRGRESMITVDADIAAQAARGRAPRFRNVHYLAAGATLYGSAAKVGYMLGDPATYSSKWEHAGGATPQCKFCHLPSHTFEPQFTATCAGCHPEAGGNIAKIRKDREVDYNGVNGTNDTLHEEVASFADALLVAMQAYADANDDMDALVYDGDAYPYFLKATGGSYTTFDALLSKAAFNYQFVEKESGAWAHNTPFIMQILYDSIDMLDDGVLNGSVPMLVRPAAM